MDGAPLIGITMSATVDATPERAYVNASYLRAVQQAGGVPLLLPAQLDARALATLARRLDGLLLTGGGDVDPARFGEPRHATVSDVAPARDALEIDLALQALDHAVPLLAICRGIQVLNVALEGTLYQDIPSEPGSRVLHSQRDPRDEASHRVKVKDGTRLAGILGRLDVDVNSFHHQAIKTVSPRLVAVAWCPDDDLIEGVELADSGAFVIGVQWHPEDLAPDDPAARNLFAALIDHSRRGPRRPPSKLAPAGLRRRSRRSNT